MRQLKIILLLLSIWILSGCNLVSSNTLFEFTLDDSYEDIAENIEKQSDENNPLFDIISIENVKYSYEEVDEFEERFNFSFDLRNLTAETIELEYLGYFPEELEQYYLSSNWIDTANRELEPDQLWTNSYSKLIQHAENLNEEEQVFLKENGHFLYMVFRIDGEKYYAEFSIGQW